MDMAKLQGFVVDYGTLKCLEHGFFVKSALFLCVILVHIILIRMERASYACMCMQVSWDVHIVYETTVYLQGDYVVSTESQS